MDFRNSLTLEEAGTVVPGLESYATKGRARRVNIASPPMAHAAVIAP
jgi:hypothetical protein